MSPLLVVARTAPVSEDGVQLGGVKRPCVLTVRIAREAAETAGAVEEPGRWFGSRWWSLKTLPDPEVSSPGERPGPLGEPLYCEKSPTS